MEVNYIGEWLGLGNLGHLFTITNMVAALLAMTAFFVAARKEDSNAIESQSWRNLARMGFGIHAVSVLGIIAVLFMLIFNHRFEFKYVWQHSSLELPVYYIVSCFWEGQEGSFLLWSFWTMVLGGVVMLTARKWENRVMTIVSVMQVFLAAMLIGIYFFNYKVGSSPFILLREDMPESPIFMRADYLNFVTDGTGLNPLLQNYWMVIHPPTLFLGFAACLLPFAYVMAGLWKRDFTDWVNPTLVWSLFAAAILGTGILMGGAWAYEALSFGGFWAWDPVENASLVPWIVLIGGIHTLLAYKHSGHALRPTAIFLIISLILILYSTFLTRSGILGDTSVHAFTDLGMSGQLLVFMFVFVGMAIYLLARGWSAMPAPEKEERMDSREFWMFVASLIMVMLAALITLDTSWPVVNKIFGTNRAIVDAVAHYNRYSIWFGIILATLSAVVQYFRYRKSNVSKFFRKLLISTVLSLLLTIFIAYSVEFYNPAYVLLLFVSIYVMVANANYIFSVLSGKIRVAGGSVAHIGFGLILLGVLLSAGKQEVISLNTLGIQYKDFTAQDNFENVLLYKDKSIQMGDYWVTYLGDSIAEPNNYYKVRYEKKQRQEDVANEVFTLYPNAQINPEMGLIANPDTRHYWTKDIFTHVSSVADRTQQAESGEFREIKLAIGDTAVMSGSFLILKGINPNPTAFGYLPLPNDVAAGAQLQILNMGGEKFEIEPVYYIRDNLPNSTEEKVAELGLTVKVEKILPDEGKIVLGVLETKQPSDFIIMKAIVFPYINVLWLGCFVMVIGFFMSMRQRVGEGRS